MSMSRQKTEITSLVESTVSECRNSATDLQTRINTQWIKTRDDIQENEKMFDDKLLWLAEQLAAQNKFRIELESQTQNTLKQYHHTALQLKIQNQLLLCLKTLKIDCINSIFMSEPNDRISDFLNNISR